MKNEKNPVRYQSIEEIDIVKSDIYTIRFGVYSFIGNPARSVSTRKKPFLLVQRIQQSVKKKDKLILFPGLTFQRPEVILQIYNALQALPSDVKELEEFGKNLAAKVITNEEEYLNFSQIPKDMLDFQKKIVVSSTFFVVKCITRNVSSYILISIGYSLDGILSLDIRQAYRSFSDHTPYYSNRGIRIFAKDKTLLENAFLKSANRLQDIQLEWEKRKKTSDNKGGRKPPEKKFI